MTDTATLRDQLADAILRNAWESIPGDGPDMGDADAARDLADAVLPVFKAREAALIQRAEEAEQYAIDAGRRTEQAEAALERARRTLPDLEAAAKRIAATSTGEAIEELARCFRAALDDARPDVCVRCGKARNVNGTADGENGDWIVTWETPLDCEHVTRDGRQ